MKILIISAHPDDLETGMGGTAQLLAKGHQVVSVVGMLPDYTKRYDRSDTPAKEIRKKESEQAHSLLGKNPIPPMFLNFIEGAGILTHDIRREFAELMWKIDPAVIFTHWPSDVNPDHRIIAALTLETFMQKGMNKEIFCYEVFSEVGRPQSLGFIPTHYCDVSNEFANKEFMVRCHKSQGDDKLWLANTEMLIRRGMEISNRQDVYAEAFVRLTRYGDLHKDLATILKTSEYDLPHSMGVEVDPKAIGL